MRLGAVAMILALAAAPAFGQEAPFNPFEKSEVGDWIAFKSSFGAGEKKDVRTNVMEVVKVEGDSVTVKSAVGGDTRTFSKKKKPTLAELIGAQPDTKVSDVKTKDEKATVGGKEWDAKLVTFKIDDDGALETKIWFHPDVKVLGFVKMVSKGVEEKKAHFAIEIEVVGFGTKEKCLWGQKREEALAKIGAGRDDEEKPAPKKDPK